ncbi:MAG: Lipoate-protein ligase A, partial [uncultured Acidimicrobiales bacterium]
PASTRARCPSGRSGRSRSSRSTGPRSSSGAPSPRPMPTAPRWRPPVWRSCAGAAVGERCSSSRPARRGSTSCSPTATGSGPTTSASPSTGWVGPGHGRSPTSVWPPRRTRARCARHGGPGWCASPASGRARSPWRGRRWSASPSAGPGSVPASSAPSSTAGALRRRCPSWRSIRPSGARRRPTSRGWPAASTSQGPRSWRPCGRTCHR